jgi:hypothetical protein
MVERERRAWGFTRLSETEERCNVCGVVVPRRASEMKLHRDLHADQEQQHSTA